jgi:CRISPR/Cas system endoribonuclease Cas6 (RAMP superfamily)
VLRYETPYYKKSLEKQKDKTPLKIEVINQKDLSKYVNLVFDTQQAHRPFAIGILLVEINEKTCKVKKINPNTVFDSNFAEVLETKVSVSNLFQEVMTFAKFYKTQI